MLVTESWLSDPLTDRILIFPGYKVVRRDRPGRPGRGRAAAARGGGVAVIYREDLSANELPITSAGPSCESLWVSVAGGRSRMVVVGVVYRPPSQPVPAGLDDLHDQLHGPFAI